MISFEKLMKIYHQRLRGCSEFPLVFPKYNQIDESGISKMKYPQKWKSIEAQFDDEFEKHSGPLFKSLSYFC